MRTSTLLVGDGTLLRPRLSETALIVSAAVPNLLVAGVNVRTPLVVKAGCTENSVVSSATTVMLVIDCSDSFGPAFRVEKKVALV